MLSIRIDKGATLAAKVRVITGLWQRHRPCDRHHLSEEQGLLLNPAASLHTFGMPCAVDAVFLDRSWQVLRVLGSLQPARFALAPRKTQLVLLLAAGRARAAQLEVGMVLTQDLVIARANQTFATTVLRRATPGHSSDP